MYQISPTELVALRQKQPELRVIDVREVDEWDYCRLDGAILRPLSELGRWEADEADRDQPVVVYCHHGVRSARVCSRLHALGLEQAINLAGGIDRWSTEVDASVLRY